MAMPKPIKCKLCDNGFYHGYWCVRCYGKIDFIPSTPILNTPEPAADEIAEVVVLRLSGEMKEVDFRIKADTTMLITALKKSKVKIRSILEKAAKC